MRSHLFVPHAKETKRHWNEAQTGPGWAREEKAAFVHWSRVVPRQVQRGLAMESGSTLPSMKPCVVAELMRNHCLELLAGK